MLAGEGLHASSQGARVRFAQGKATVSKGPFPETRQLVAGYWIWRVKSLDEAIEWIKRSPFRNADGEEIEIRRMFETEDFGPEMTPELQEREAQLRAQAAKLAAED